MANLKNIRFDHRCRKCYHDGDFRNLNILLFIFSIRIFRRQKVQILSEKHVHGKKGKMFKSFKKLARCRFGNNLGHQNNYVGRWLLENFALLLIVYHVNYFHDLTKLFSTKFLDT